MKAWEISLLNKFYRSQELFKPLEGLFLTDNINFHHARNEILKLYNDNLKKASSQIFPSTVHTEKANIDNSMTNSFKNSSIIPSKNLQNEQSLEFTILKEKTNGNIFPSSSLEKLKELESITKKGIVDPQDELNTLFTICNYLTYKDLFEHSFSFIQVLDQIKTKNHKLFISEGFEYVDVLVFSALGRCRSWKAIAKDAKSSIPSLFSWFEWTKDEHKEIAVFHIHPSIQSKKDQKVTKQKQLLKNYHPEFIKAIRENDIPTIDQYLKSGVNIECIDPNDKNKTACHIACENGNLELVKLLIKNGCNLEAQDCEEMTPFFYALSNENLELIEFLISLGVNVEHGDCQYRTPFYWASSTCSLSIVKYLYSKGCKIDTVSKMNRSPLSKAAYTGRSEIVEFIVSCPEAQINEAGERGRTALQMAVWGRAGGRQGKKVGHMDAADSPEIAKILLKNGANIHQKDHEGNTALHTASASFAEASIPILMKFGADINNQNNAGETPLYRASDKGYIEICKLLVEDYKADPFIKSQIGLDCLEIAITNQHFPLSNYYINALAKKFDQDDNYFDTITNLISTHFKQEEAFTLLKILFANKSKSSSFFFSSKTLESLINHKNEEVMDMLIDWFEYLIQTQMFTNQEEKFRLLTQYGFNTKWAYCLKSLVLRFQSEVSKISWRWIDLNLDFDKDELFYLLQNFNIDIFFVNDQSETFLHYLVKTKNVKLLSSVTQFITSTLQTIQALHSSEILDNIYLKKIDLPFIIDYLNIKSSEGYSACEMALIHKNYGASTILEQLVGQKLKNLLIIPSYELFVEEEFDRAHKLKSLLIDYENILEESHPNSDNLLTKLKNVTKGELITLQNICQLKFTVPNQDDKQNHYERLISERKIIFVDDEKSLQNVSQKLISASIIGVDMECYVDDDSKNTFVCLLQISTVSEDFIIDCLKLHSFIYQYLQTIFAAENIIKVFHGCDNDLKWLKSNFDIDVMNLFDTSRAYMLLTNDTISMGLSTLTLKFLGFELNKAYQKADWRVRPLPKVMMDYARGDSCVLLYLWYLLDNQIKSLENGLDLEKQLTSRMLRKCWKTLEEGTLKRIRVAIKIT